MTMANVEDTEVSRRCSACVIPASLPGSDFNDAGECAWCQSGFPNYVPVGPEKLHQVLDCHRSVTGSADCLVGISGGKDSSYALMELKRTFGVNVEAFTYVHDGLTDYALQNARDVCRAMDVKHHLVSLPGHRHLTAFKAFFRAWVKSEEPVAAAMTCVACKHLHILGTRLAKERGIPMVVWSESPLETPPFIPTQRKDGIQAASRGLAGLGMVLARNLVSQSMFRKAFVENMSTCVFGCLAFRPDTGYLRRRYPSVTHVRFYDYCAWDGAAIIRALKAQTAWSIPESVVSDWHSDCIFNVFKEYMFQKMVGASYTDAFLSNQVRHGLMTRSQAWEDLARSKRYYARELGRALSILGMDELQTACDQTCFDIENR
jgi:glutamine---fructose-6-phosphate transaminase (isomerizing)